jgi:hypothetical protein
MEPDLATNGRQFNIEDRAQLIIQGNRMYLHKVLRVNYSTYDVRRAQDSMNPRNHANIMTLARSWDDGSHPFSYARILGLLHVDVIHKTPITRPAPKTMEVLWVQWFRLDTRWKGGFARHRLYRVQPVPSDLEHAYGFLEPDDVIRGAHLIPAFAHGWSELDDDWKYYYVNM